ncbi:MAG TPA: SgcJ/EcaC family oxidoreductase [Methylomirabilota bacterium]|nr:SgcJ/EcaC family oxidoreductase [Methylomirabilota bacterium]
MPAYEPEDCDRLFAEYLNAGNLEGLVALYEPTCAMVQRDGSLAVGHAAIRASLERLVAMKPRMDFRIIRVVPGGEGLAMVYNDWSFSAAGPDGQPVTRAGQAIEVVRRQPDGTWRLAADDPFARGGAGGQS